MDGGSDLVFVTTLEGKLRRQENGWLLLLLSIVAAIRPHHQHEKTII